MNKVGLVALLFCVAASSSAGADNVLKKAGSWLDSLRGQPASAAAMTDDATAPATNPAGQPHRATPDAVVVGTKRVPISSAELDGHCERVVQPFELKVNFVDLAKLAASGAAETLPNVVAQGGNETQVAASRHRISRSVREHALKLNWLPMSLERRYGRHIHDQAVAAGDLVERDSSLGRRLYPKADELLVQLLAGVRQPHPYTFELHIRKSSEDNAIALPGGIIYLDAGLLRSEDLAKARFALSHELSHVLRRHETRITQARLIDTISLTGSVTDLVGIVRDPGKVSSEVLKTAAAGHNVFQRHYADQELQADACAVRVLDAALDDASNVEAAIAAFIASLPADAPAEPATASHSVGPEAQTAALANLVTQVGSPIDRHPNSRERVANLEGMLTLVRNLPRSGGEKR